MFNNLIFKFFNKRILCSNCTLITIEQSMKFFLEMFCDVIHKDIRKFVFFNIVII